MFDQEEQKQIRLRLADTLRWVISQRLAPKLGGGRHALLEIMGNNLRTKDSILTGEGEGRSFYEVIEASYTFGWRTFDQACLKAYEEGVITEEDAILYCSKRGPVTRGIDNIKKERGEYTSDINPLKMSSSGEKGEKTSGPPAPATLKLK
jgi:twitching motility protein PilT